MNTLKLLGVLGGMYSAQRCFRLQNKGEFKVFGFEITAQAAAWIKNWDHVEDIVPSEDSEDSFLVRPAHFRDVVFLCPRMESTNSTKEQEFNDRAVKSFLANGLPRFLSQKIDKVSVLCAPNKESWRFSLKVLNHLQERLPSEMVNNYIEQEGGLGNLQVGFAKPQGSTMVMPHRSFVDRSTLELMFREHFHRPDDHNSLNVFVGSPNAIKFLVTRCLQLPIESWNRLQPAEGSYSNIRIFSDGTVKLGSLGTLTHLQYYPTDMFLPD